MGLAEWLIILIVVVGIPAGVLWAVANARHQSRRYVLWALLGYLGLIIGILIMIAMPRKGTGNT